MNRSTAVFLTLLLLLVAPHAALGQPPATGTIALYADEARAYIATCPFPAGYPVGKVEMWIWCLPGSNGLMGADFGVSYPYNVIRDRISWNPGLAEHTGDFADGCSARFSTCQESWTWIAHESLYISSHVATFAELVLHAGVGALRFMDCTSPGCCWEDCLKGSGLFFNTSLYPCLPPELAIAAESPTWGCIKGLFAG